MQWGRARVFEDSGVRVHILPHVNTGGVWAPITPTSTIDELFTLDVCGDAAQLLADLKERYVGKPYSEWDV